jgi:hypothetical protein
LKWTGPSSNNTTIVTLILRRIYMRRQGTWARGILAGTLCFALSSIMGCSDSNSKKKAGETCSASGDCETNVCYSSVCVSASPKATGDTCAASYECKSFSCVSTKCAAGKSPAGTKCLYAEECASGSCTSSKCGGGSDAAVDIGGKTEAGATDGGQKAEAGKKDGGSSKKVEEYLPTDNGISGWIVGRFDGGGGFQHGYNKKDIELAIDGHYDAYYAACKADGASDCNGYAKQDYAYKTDAGTVEFVLMLELFDMSSATACKSMLAYHKTQAAKAGIAYSTASGVKDDAIWGDDLPEWKSWGYKGHIYWEIFGTYSAGQSTVFEPIFKAYVSALSNKLP